MKQVESDRIVVEAWGNPGTGIDKIEMRVLARAASEALDSGYAHFALVHVSDRNLPMGGGLGPAPIAGAEPVWIGDYESLVYNRYERDHAAAPRTWVLPGLRAVVVMLSEGDRRADRGFEASEVFDHLGRVPL
ncbi:hypothetical protein [Hyphomonas sp. L-53-1-40]|uniref:hypothetical protein n=1 Tax=Hyphomonas sp. L-53-1-40 TaxID=1207058 RepID=UPI0012EC883C|nr:hypothetical protein [Hyphomonas sp. L-53-1-40]